MIRLERCTWLSIALASAMLTSGARGADFTFNVPVQFDMTCKKPTSIFVSCLVAVQPPNWPDTTFSDDGAVGRGRAQNGASGNIIGGNRPAYTGPGAGNEARIVYGGNTQSINTTVTVSFDAKPGASPADAKKWRCYTALEISGFGGGANAQFVTPGSVNQLHAPEHGANCAYRKPGSQLSHFSTGDL